MYIPQSLLDIFDCCLNGYLIMTRDFTGGLLAETQQKLSTGKKKGKSKEGATINCPGFKI